MSSSPLTEKFNVVILYEQRAFVGKAMSVYFQIRRELGNDFEAELRIWRIDVATLAELAAQANGDIAAADLILISVRGGQPCPAPFQRWRTGTGPGLGAPRGAVIAITETVDEPTPDTATWHSVLRDFTTQIHPEIFVWEAPVELSAARSAPPVGEQVPQWAGAASGE